MQSRTIALVAIMAVVASAARLRRHTLPQKANPMSLLAQGKAVVALDKDMRTQMLVQVNSSIVDPCEGITCGALECPTGFQATEVEGHCCSYCVNPNIKIEPPVTGASGEFGGKESSFCPDVWCFPTMCEKEEVLATTDNGQCCGECPK
mmetsp:Transcript_1975/g.3699  ORF Transcript_1975/g.3699 Transcript_1975/m.3699 type:complete len:149 (+) Transcript_1975:73-519(+)|eukprot:CAMPEP_0197663066 /NCGR_PEP_ID=MMETSP1338-20131121/55992_1 /TAXON_ID=43686 ORGANISM="Pelagodinium beii, Strain RCC1491" /NCGR_SAMPLE_ID=MMETSP1338 /ASSEMBLY_ACC=CAM_ASM_000754 /LENGTH=148 /DNA_ID=CAMNT_0043241259 /DNA_START=68 /DNA_END=514 /DNA_ORIENTATION=+